MKLMIDIPNEWFDQMVREEFTKVDELCAIILHSVATPSNWSQADGDLISRQAVIKAVDKHTLDRSEIVLDEDITVILEEVPTVAIPSAEPKTGHLKDFVMWVASEIFDDNWEYNKDAFAEIACRKLNKLGIVKANGDEWELTEPQESEET